MASLSVSEYSNLLRMSSISELSGGIDKKLLISEHFDFMTFTITE